MKITNPKYSTAETLGYKTGQVFIAAVGTAVLLGIAATVAKLVWWIWQQPW